MRLLDLDGARGTWATRPYPGQPATPRGRPVDGAGVLGLVATAVATTVAVLPGARDRAGRGRGAQHGADPAARRPPADPANPAPDPPRRHRRPPAIPGPPAEHWSSGSTQSLWRRARMCRAATASAVRRGAGGRPGRRPVPQHRQPDLRPGASRERSRDGPSGATHPPIGPAGSSEVTAGASRGRLGSIARPWRNGQGLETHHRRGPAAHAPAGGTAGARVPGSGDRRRPLGAQRSGPETSCRRCTDPSTDHWFRAEWEGLEKIPTARRGAAGRQPCRRHARSTPR